MLFMNDGKQMISCAEDKSVRVWDKSSGQVKSQQICIVSSGDCVLCLCFVDLYSIQVKYTRLCLKTLTNHQGNFRIIIFPCFDDLSSYHPSCRFCFFHLSKCSCRMFPKHFDHQ